MAVDFDAQVHLADLRVRVLNGEKLEPAEYRDLYLDLRRGRDVAAAATKAAAAKARKAATPAKPKLDIHKLFNAPIRTMEEVVESLINKELQNGN